MWSLRSSRDIQSPPGGFYDDFKDVEVVGLVRIEVPKHQCLLCSSTSPIQKKVTSQILSFYEHFSGKQGLFLSDAH